MPISENSLIVKKNIWRNCKKCPFVNNDDAVVLIVYLHAPLLSTPLVLNWFVKTKHVPLKILKIRGKNENTDSRLLVIRSIKGTNPTPILYFSWSYHFKIIKVWKKGSFSNDFFSAGKNFKVCVVAVKWRSTKICAKDIMLI